jgi:cell division protein FtsQ
VKTIEKGLTDYSSNPPSLILGKQKSREIRKGRTFWERTLLFFKVAGIIGTVVFVLVFTLWARHLLLHSANFDITIKEVQGLRYVSESQVLMKLREFESRSNNILLLDIAQLRQSIERIPWVREAVVRRSLPNKISILVKEREPVGFARISQGTLLVDDEGVLLENDPEMHTQFDFPILVGLETGYDPEILAKNRQRVARYRSLIRTLDENGAGLSKDLSEVLISDPDNISVILNDDTVVVQLGNENLQGRFRHYLAMGKELKQKYPLLDSVDMRYQNQIVINTASQSAHERIASETESPVER